MQCEAPVRGCERKVNCRRNWHTRMRPASPLFPPPVLPPSSPHPTTRGRPATQSRGTKDESASQLCEGAFSCLLPPTPRVSAPCPRLFTECARALARSLVRSFLYPFLPSTEATFGAAKVGQRAGTLRRNRKGDAKKRGEKRKAPGYVLPTAVRATAGASLYPSRPVRTRRGFPGRRRGACPGRRGFPGRR